MEWKTAECRNNKFEVCQQAHDEKEGKLCTTACVLMAVQRILDVKKTSLSFPLPKNATPADVLYVIGEGRADEVKKLSVKASTNEALTAAFGQNREKVFLLTYQGKNGGHCVIAEQGLQGGLVICDPWDGSAYFTASPKSYKKEGQKLSLSDKGILEVTPKAQ